MTIWVLHQKLTPEEEQVIDSRTELALPFEEFPDFRMAKTMSGYRQLLQQLHMDAPPESINRLMEKSWQLYHSIHKEDIFAVPLPGLGEVALAEATGTGGYHVGPGGEDVHTIPVKWYPRRVRIGGKHKELFAPGKVKLFEVQNAEARTMIRDKLPHAYNRFAKFKWLLVMFFAWRIFMFFTRRMEHMPGATSFFN